MSVFDLLPGQVARLDALLEEVQGHPHRATLARTAEQGIRLAESLTQQCPEDADAWFLLGLAWYAHPSSASWRAWRCRNALEHVLKRAPGHQHARYHLACLAFDQERFDEAITHLDRLDFTGADPAEAAWRALKIAELTLVARIRLKPDPFPTADFEAYAQWFLETHATTPGALAPPQEMSELAEWLYARGQRPEARPLALLLAFIKAAGFSEGLWDAKLRDMCV